MQKRIENLLKAVQDIASYEGPHTGEDVGVLMEIAQEAVQQDIALQHLNESDAEKKRCCEAPFLVCKNCGAWVGK